MRRLLPGRAAYPVRSLPAADAVDGIEAVEDSIHGETVLSRLAGSADNGGMFELDRTRAQAKRDLDRALARVGRSARKEIERAVHRGEAVRDPRHAALAVQLARYVQSAPEAAFASSHRLWLYRVGLVSLPLTVLLLVGLVVVVGAFDALTIFLPFLAALVLFQLAALGLRLWVGRATRRAAEAERLNAQLAGFK